MNSNRRVAIIGAGGAGVCTALELVERGFRVDLFEREPQAVSQASFVNEGKIHLGLIYAKDETLETSTLMIRGALEFLDDLRRWIPFDAEAALSTPFYYCAHRGSLMEPDQLSRHYARCADRYRELAGVTGRDYLGLGSGSSTRRLPESEFPQELDPAFFSAVFETTEYGVDARILATSLRHAVEREDRVQLRCDTRVVGVSAGARSGFEVRFEVDGQTFTETYSDVVNATWYRRLALDAPMGIKPPAAWSHRYKFANRIMIPLHPDELPSCTCVQGPFGDIVNYRGQGLFLSWYPTGRTGMSTAVSPPDWHARYSPEQRLGVFETSFAEWLRRCPALAKLPLDEERVDPEWGRHLRTRHGGRR